MDSLIKPQQSQEGCQVASPTSRTLRRTYKTFSFLNIMTKELRQLQYNDVLTDLASAIETSGCRRLLIDFRENYPNHFQEIVDQIHRLDQRPVAALLRPNDATAM